MLNLITRTRLLIGDTDNVSPVFTADEIEDTLDQHRRDIWFAVLRPLPTFLQGQPIKYLDYVADGSMGGIEGNYKLQRTDFSELAGPTVGYAQVQNFEQYPAKWTILADSGEPGGIRGTAVRLTAYGYDLYYAASDLLRIRASKVMLEFSFSDERAKFNRQEQFANLISLADNYLKQAQPISSRLFKGDDFPEHAGSGIVYPATNAITGGQVIP